MMKNIYQLSEMDKIFENSYDFKHDIWLKFLGNLPDNRCKIIS